jgi:F-type H+-transporting ATPase subunit alpha
MAFVLFAADQGFLDDVPLTKVTDFDHALLSDIRSNHSDLLAKINESGDYNDEIARSMRAAVESFKKTSTW